MHERLEACPVQRMDPPDIGKRTWDLAERHGWGRTYDAEYVALAQILDCRLVTLDGRLRRGAAQLGIVIGLPELIVENEQAAAEPEQLTERADDAADKPDQD